MKPEFVVSRNGKDFVLYAGLLDQAHTQGLKAIATHMLQAPCADNGNTAIVHATATTERGAFDGLGDASPDNVSRAMAPHLLRLAETRAKARALRDAINVTAALIDDDTTHEQDAIPGEITYEGADTSWKPIATRGTPNRQYVTAGPQASAPAPANQATTREITDLIELARNLEVAGHRCPKLPTGGSDKAVDAWKRTIREMAAKHPNAAR